MKYLDKKFSSPANSKQFVDNWDAIFGEKEKPKDPPSEDPPEPPNHLAVSEN